VDPDGLRGDLPIFLPIPAREDYGTIFPQWMPAWIIDILYDIDNDPTAGLGGPGKAGLKIVCKTGLKQAEAKAARRISNILDRNFKAGPKGDIAGAMKDMIGNPVPKPGGGYYDHVLDLNNILRGLRNNAEALRNTIDPAMQAIRQRAIGTIQAIEDAIKGAGI
jgi:hypothetical protein